VPFAAGHDIVRVERCNLARGRFRADLNDD